jgi:hypothetical protein
MQGGRAFFLSELRICALEYNVARCPVAKAVEEGRGVHSTHTDEGVLL